MKEMSKRKTMIECTLQEAIIKSNKDKGGAYWSKKNQPLKFSTDDMGQPVHAGSSTPAMFHAERYEETWIYEPPKQSAFQKWNTENPHITETRTEHRFKEYGRKEGWNAAIDEVAKLPPHDSLSDRSLDKILDLKEL